MFRDDHPYDFGSKGANNVFIKNNNRFVHTWMDDYKGKFVCLEIHIEINLFKI